MSKVDCTKSITDLFEFHFEIPGHEPDYVSLEETAQSLAALGQEANAEELRKYFKPKSSWKVPFFLSFVAPFFEGCANVLLDFVDDGDRKFQFYAGSGLIKSSHHKRKGIEVLNELADKFLQGDTYQIDPDMFRELLEEESVSKLDGLDELKNKIRFMEI